MFRSSSNAAAICSGFVLRFDGNFANFETTSRSSLFEPLKRPLGQTKIARSLRPSETAAALAAACGSLRIECPLERRQWRSGCRIGLRTKPTALVVVGRLLPWKLAGVIRRANEIQIPTEWSEHAGRRAGAVSSLSTRIGTPPLRSPARAEHTRTVATGTQRTRVSYARSVAARTAKAEAVVDVVRRSAQPRRIHLRERIIACVGVR